MPPQQQFRMRRSGKTSHRQPPLPPPKLGIPPPQQQERMRIHRMQSHPPPNKLFIYVPPEFVCGFIRLLHNMAAFGKVLPRFIPPKTAKFRFLSVKALTKR